MYLKRGILLYFIDQSLTHYEQFLKEMLTDTCEAVYQAVVYNL